VVFMRAVVALFKGRLAGLVVCGVAAAVAHGADRSSIAALVAEWNQPAEPFHVLGPIYYVGTEELGAWLIQTQAGLILLDGGLPESAPLIENNIKRLGFRLTDIRYLLNSHAHFDHSGGLAQLKRDTGAQMLASAGDRISLETGTYLGSEDVAAVTAPPVAVDRVIGDGDIVQLGEVKLTALVMPGHTRGCTSWLMPIRDQDVAHQVIFYCSTTVAANRLVPKPQYPGIIDDYRATFARLKEVRADVFLSNHKDFFDLWGKRSRLGQSTNNPFINADELQAFVALSAVEFERDLAAQSRAALRKE
jgi:metallo-beta-lactamase class B